MPPSGTWFLAVTLVGGAFPSGWFHGVDIPLPELVGEITFGFPFSGPLGACGSAVLGPFCAGLTGLSVFAVALGIDGPTLGPWTAVSAPMSYVVP
jgi:hypothetical protein